MILWLQLYSRKKGSGMGRHPGWVCPNTTAGLERLSPRHGRIDTSFTVCFLVYYSDMTKVFEKV